MTMRNIRSNFGIPSLRQVTKSAGCNCHGCKRHFSVPFPKPKSGPKPNDR